MVTDTIGDTITRLFNASVRGIKETEVLYSMDVVRLLEVLKRTGFITDFRVEKEEDSSFSKIFVELKYDASKKPKISNVRRISKPGCRIYHRHSEVKKVLQGYGVGVYSTSIGVLSDKEAYLKGVGGEYWCEVF